MMFSFLIFTLTQVWPESLFQLAISQKIFQNFITFLKCYTFNGTVQVGSNHFDFIFSCSVTWKGYEGPEAQTWEPKENLLSCEDLLNVRTSLLLCL